MTASVFTRFPSSMSALRLCSSRRRYHNPLHVSGDGGVREKCENGTLAMSLFPSMLPKCSSTFSRMKFAT